MKIILLSGKQGSGKTTLSQDLANYLVSKGKTVAIFKFADILYRMHDMILDELHNYFPDRGLVKDGPLLQLLGTDWGRKTVDENIWVKIIKSRIEKETSANFIIVDDCRFENEFDAFPEALRVRLRAEEGCRKKRCSMWRENTSHPSETGLDSYCVQGKFDLYLNTDDWDLPSCRALVLAQIDKNVWQEKRKK